MNWIGSERGQRSINQQSKKQRKWIARRRRHSAALSAAANRQASKAAHPTAFPATWLAAGQLWFSKGKQIKNDVVLPTQMTALHFGTNSIFQQGLAPASHTKLKFIVQHILTDIQSVKDSPNLLNHDSATSWSLLLQDLFCLCSPQPLAAVGSEVLTHWGSQQLPLPSSVSIPGWPFLHLTGSAPRPCPSPTLHLQMQPGVVAWCSRRRAVLVLCQATLMVYWMTWVFQIENHLVQFRTGRWGEEETGPLRWSLLSVWKFIKVFWVFGFFCMKYYIFS